MQAGSLSGTDRGVTRSGILARCENWIAYFVCLAVCVFFPAWAAAQGADVSRPAKNPGQANSPRADEANLTVVHPAEIPDPLVNPYCGWGLWAGPRFFDSRRFSLEYNTKGFGDDAPLFSWALLDWTWADLEPQEGKFDWSSLDAIIDYWKARHKQFLVRLWVTSDPGWAGAPGNKACPDWLWERGVAFHEYRGEGNALQRQPDYCAPSYQAEYLPRLRRFLTAYRGRYCQPGGPVFMNQVMGFGDWGEWHTMWSHYHWPTRDAKRRILAQLIHLYLDVFAGNRAPGSPVPQLSTAQVYDEDCGGDTPLEEATRRQALDVALTNGLTFTRHGFIDGMSGWPNDFILKYWRQSPMLAEANWSYEQVKRDKNHGTMPEFIDAFIKFHSTYTHMYLHADSYKQAMAQDRGEFERALRPGGVGYRFVLTAAEWETTRRPGQALTLHQQWVNRNASWCVYPFRLKVYLTKDNGQTAWSSVDRAFDPRGWIPETDYPAQSVFQLPNDLRPGTYHLRLAWVDDTATPRVRLGILGADEQLRYVIGDVKVQR